MKLSSLNFGEGLHTSLVSLFKKSLSIFRKAKCFLIHSVFMSIVFFKHGIHNIVVFIHLLRVWLFAVTLSLCRRDED